MPIFEGKTAWFGLDVPSAVSKAWVANGGARGKLASEASGGKKGKKKKTDEPQITYYFSGNAENETVKGLMSGVDGRSAVMVFKPEYVADAITAGELISPGAYILAPAELVTAGIELAPPVYALRPPRADSSKKKKKDEKKEEEEGEEEGSLSLRERQKLTSKAREGYRGALSFVPKTDGEADATALESISMTQPVEGWRVVPIEADEREQPSGRGTAKPRGARRRAAQREAEEEREKKKKTSAAGSERMRGRVVESIPDSDGDQDEDEEEAMDIVAGEPRVVIEEQSDDEEEDEHDSGAGVGALGNDDDVFTEERGQIAGVKFGQELADAVYALSGDTLVATSVIQGQTKRAEVSDRWWTTDKESVLVAKIRNAGQRGKLSKAQLNRVIASVVQATGMSHTSCVKRIAFLELLGK